MDYLQFLYQSMLHLVSSLLQVLHLTLLMVFGNLNYKYRFVLKSKYNYDYNLNLMNPVYNIQVTLSNKVDRMYMFFDNIFPLRSLDGTPAIIASSYVISPIE